MYTSKRRPRQITEPRVIATIIIIGILLLVVDEGDKGLGLGYVDAVLKKTQVNTKSKSHSMRTLTMTTMLAMH